jgi:hypothetical protein
VYLVFDKGGGLFHNSHATELAMDFEEPLWFFSLQGWLFGILSLGEGI